MYLSVLNTNLISQIERLYETRTFPLRFLRNYPVVLISLDLTDTKNAEWRWHEMQKRMRLFAGRSTDEVSLACIARSFEQQRAIYGITLMINGTALARGTLPPCFPILFCSPLHTPLSFLPACARPPTSVDVLPATGPSWAQRLRRLRNFIVHEPADELFA